MKYIIICLLLITVKVSAQNIIPFSSPRWKIQGKEVVNDTFQGKQCLKITNGNAWLTDANFTNGIIEFDMALVKDRYFPGMSFRAKDANNEEEYYVRPHQSGNPDAMQYCPNYNGGGGWQLYYGDGFGNPHEIPVDRWLHIKLLVKDSMAEVYFDDEKQPALFIRKLYRPIAAGMIALRNDWPAPARFANFTYTETNNITLLSKAQPLQPLSANVFTSWQVSNTFDEKLLAGKSSLSSAHIENLSWQTLSTDDRGIADLARLAPTSEHKNTVLAKVTIHSDKAAVKKFVFGFSDRVRLFCNDKLLYSGDDVYRSRDYRFLGTMGYYDAVYIDLKPGDNEVVLAISEDFGGWGVMGKLEDF